MGEGRNYHVKEVEPILLVHLYTHTTLNPPKKGFRGWISGEILSFIKRYQRDRCRVCGIYSLLNWWFVNRFKVPYIAYYHIYCITVKCKQCERYSIDEEIKLLRKDIQRTKNSEG